MRELSLEENELSIYIALKVSPKHVRRGLLQHCTDDAARAMAKHIVAKLNIVEAFGPDQKCNPFAEMGIGEKNDGCS